MSKKTGRVPASISIGGKMYRLFATDADDPVSLEYIVRAVNAFEPMREALEAVEWGGNMGDNPMCPSCMQFPEDAHESPHLCGHAPDCQLAQALALARE